MPDGEQPAAGAAEQGAAQGGGMIGTLIRVVLIYFFVKNVFGGGGGAKAPPPGLAFQPLINRTDPVSLRVFISEADTLEADVLGAGPVWEAPRFMLPLPAEHSRVVTYRPSRAVQNNGSVFVHAVFEATVQELQPALEWAEGEEPDDVSAGGGERIVQFTRTWPLNAYMPRPKVTDGVNLLSGKNDDGKEATQEEQKAAAAAPREIINFLKPNITINLIDLDFKPIARAQLQPNQLAWIHMDEIARTYEPVAWFNDFWTLKDYMVPVNSSLPELNITFSVSSMGQMKWMLYLQMEQSFSMQKSMGSMGEGDQDEFKRVLLEGNPYYLALTFAVSLLHSVFDMLAFKNDIGFWKDKKSVEGLSIKTILINCVCQVVIFLYLMDNETSFVILASTFVGILIEFWKVTKAMDVSVDRTGTFPKLVFKDRASYAESDTKKYDDEAIKYLSWILYPCVLAFGAYSLIYKSHKSWYSFVLNTLVGAVYAFGFILMCPQLYLNYRLKSVAHINQRQMTYKFLSTIVDDLMAFAIKMPTLHRLAVFRDDLVFVVFLYQRWIYRIDPTRVNEFGWSPEAPADAVEGTPASATGAVALPPTAAAAATTGESAAPTAAAAAAAGGAAAGGTGAPRPASVSSNEGFEVVEPSDATAGEADGDASAPLRQRKPIAAERGRT
mmetsp:Transcript_8115/g.24117  ORF Transcript_8115/g.24117 Transcript_8115/m.24117 type:complete len:668 (-) Transcript_8115:416-2419(-)